MRFGRRACNTERGRPLRKSDYSGTEEFWKSHNRRSEFLDRSASENTATRRLFGSIAVTFQRGFRTRPAKQPIATLSAVRARVWSRT